MEQRIAEKYQAWCEYPLMDEENREKLRAMAGDEQAIIEAFYQDLAFGTAGLRGILGPGTNRMNLYTVGKATQGLSNYIVKQGEKAMQSGVVIAYDSRIMSEEFARHSASILAANGIHVYLFDALRPTPELSFAIRHLKTTSGIVITASHNPAQYNGYKAYGADGAQLANEEADAVLAEINALDIFRDVKTTDFEQATKDGKIEIIGRAVDEAYLSCVMEQSVATEETLRCASDLKIVYTPLHGAGNKLVLEVLERIGFHSVSPVVEQQVPDGRFPTVKSPNPEDKACFALAIELARKEGAELILGTDPDGDRLGILILDRDGEYLALNGNQVGVLLLNYVLSQRLEQGRMPQNPFAVKTIVTTELARRVAEHYQVELVDVLTGFKYIGDQIKDSEETGLRQFVFGFEESYGYLSGTYARDKDSVVASMLTAEMTAWYRSRNMSLREGLEEIYARHGYYLDALTSIVREGKQGAEEIRAMMERFRNELPASVDGATVTAIRDYQESTRKVLASGEVETICLPKSNVIYVELSDGSYFIVRPSGTEPKIKIYFAVCEASKDASMKRINSLQKAVLSFVGQEA